MSRRSETRQTLRRGVGKLPTLTAKELAFVEGILAGKTGSDAYRGGYDTSTMSPTSISAEASRMRRKPAIDAWIRAGHIAHLTSGVLSKEEHIRELGAIRELSKEQGDLKSAVAAEHLRGKASGFYVERSEITVYDPAAILSQIRNIDPEIARRLAERFNVPLPALLAPAGDASTDVLDLTAEPSAVPSVPPPDRSGR